MADTPSKSKVAFVLLGVLLGSLGIHNFYIGRTKQGVIQLLITVLSAGMLDRKSTRLNSSHIATSRMPSSA